MRIACILITLALGLGIGCKVHYNGPMDAKELAMISEGGGFTGAMTTYTLLKNGQVFKSTSYDDTAAELNPIPRKKARELMKEIRNATDTKTPIREPDNIYRVLRYHEKDTTYSVTWHINRPELDSIYNKVLNEIITRNAAVE